MRTPLELLYHGWAGKGEVEYDTCTWVEMLRDRVELARDVAREKLEVARDIRKDVYDRGAIERSFECGDIVWQRQPGFDANLTEVWTGPFKVVAMENKVNYKIRKVDGTGDVKVVHINVLKRCVERAEAVCRLVVVGELGEVECGSGVKLKEHHRSLMRRMWLGCRRNLLMY